MLGRPQPLAVFVATLAAGVVTAAGSSADQTPSLVLEPAPAGDRAFVVERAIVRGRHTVSTRLVLDYAHAPLVLKNGNQDADAVVSAELVAHALASLALAHRLQLGADVPIVLLESGDAAPASGATAPRPGSSSSLGDLRLGARLKLVGSAPEAETRVNLAIGSWFWAPTATGEYGGDGSARVRGSILFDGESRRLFWAWNGGVRTRPSEQLPGYLPTRVGTSLTFGLAAGFFADKGRDVSLGTEVMTDMPFGGGASLLDPRATVLHVLLTSHIRVAGGPFELGAAFGPGLAEGAGSAAWRALFVAGYAPEESPPPSDADDDGVPDATDACVKLAGVPSGDPLLNGCPEPPPDRDGDAIPDEYDACPRVPGEPTGIRATNGCPPMPDSDHDGVPDPMDACPNEPGEPPPKGNGCPKPARPRTELVQESIVLSQQVQFETGTAVLRAESDTVLAEAARVLSEHPELEVVEVQGHTDEVGTPEYNRKLGQERADSVVGWLAGHGVARERLVAKGYGSDRPIADNTTEEGRAKNRRVEFRVIRTRSNPTQGGKP